MAHTYVVCSYCLFYFHSWMPRLQYKYVGQWSAGLSFNQGVGGSIPALVDVSLSKTLNSELLPVAVSPVYQCKSLWIKASAK